MEEYKGNSQCAQSICVCQLLFSEFSSYSPTEPGDREPFLITRNMFGLQEIYISKMQKRNYNCKFSKANALGKSKVKKNPA